MSSPARAVVAALAVAFAYYLYITAPSGESPASQEGGGPAPLFGCPYLSEIRNSDNPEEKTRQLCQDPEHASSHWCKKYNTEEL